MKIEQGKEYMTKNGLRWSAYAFSARGNFPIHGAFQWPNGSWEVGAWREDGTHSGCSEWNLMPAPKSIYRTRWVNVFEDYERIYYSKWDADNAMRGEPETRLACIPVTIEGTEGDNLEE